MSPDGTAPNEKELRELAGLLAAFNESTAQLQTSHDALQARIGELSGELASKNQALSASLAEVGALKNYLANILESITDGVVAIDLDRRVVALNQAAGEIVVRLTIDQIGRPIADVLPDACAELGRLLVRALEEKRRFSSLEIRLGGPDGGRTLAVSASPIRNENGDLLGAVETFRDLSDMKALEARAARQERLAALGEMAAGVAHEIRNPLGGIELCATTIRRALPAGTREADLAGRIIAATTSLNRIVEDMLTFTRHREPDRRSVTPEHICRLAVDLAAAELDKREAKVAFRFGTDGQRFPLDPDLLCQAFLNVIRNAAEAMAPGGTLAIETSTREEGGQVWLRFAFADEGPGVPEEIRDRIFHPFFTTRAKGTGLGLAITHKILQDHGGTVAVEENQPRGAIFVFRVPVGVA